MPALTFVAPANAITYLGAHPVFQDVDGDDWQVDVAEARRFLDGELDAPPPFPENYFSPDAARLAADWIEDAIQRNAAGEPIPDTLEQQIADKLDNTWGDTAKAIVNNWLD